MTRIDAPLLAHAAAHGVRLVQQFGAVTPPPSY